MIGIYKIENKINKRVYIGQSTDIQKRWKDHINNCNASKYNYAIYVAMRKYGIENFTFEILEECPKDKLSEREKYWIDFYETNTYGYNIKSGG